MLATFLIAACAAAELDRPPADSLDALYQRGRTFGQFLAAARQRREAWRENYAWGKVDGDLLARGRALVAGWRLLVVAEDWCGDSANTIPYLATLVDSLGGRVELRMVNSTEGRWIMERHRTEDSRAATPTVVILDPSGAEVGCWVERPSTLARWMRGEKGRLSQDELLDRKYAWYAENRGRDTVSEILDQIEHAAPGQPCSGNTGNADQRSRSTSPSSDAPSINWGILNRSGSARWPSRAARLGSTDASQVPGRTLST